MTGDSSPSDADPRIRRRNFLAALGAGTVTAVAGCTDSGGDGDGSGDGGDSDGGTGGLSPTLVAGGVAGAALVLGGGYVLGRRSGGGK